MGIERTAKAMTRSFPVRVLPRSRPEPLTRTLHVDPRPVLVQSRAGLVEEGHVGEVRAGDRAVAHLHRSVGLLPAPDALEEVPDVVLVAQAARHLLDHLRLLRPLV